MGRFWPVLTFTPAVALCSSAASKSTRTRTIREGSALAEGPRPEVIGALTGCRQGCTYGQIPGLSLHAGSPCRSIIVHPVHPCSVPRSTHPEKTWTHPPWRSQPRPARGGWEVCSQPRAAGALPDAPAMSACGKPGSRRRRRARGGSSAGGRSRPGNHGRGDLPRPPADIGWPGGRPAARAVPCTPGAGSKVPGSRESPVVILYRVDARGLRLAVRRGRGALRPER